MVVKVISTAGDRNSARKLLNYVARVRDGDEAEPRVPVWTGTGEPAVTGERGFRAARTEATAAFEALEIPTPAQLRDRGMTRDRPVLHHLTVSFPDLDPHDPSAIAAAREATEGATAELFDSRGYRTLWALHNGPAAGDEPTLEPDRRDHGHVHAHILIRTDPEHEDMPRLRFDPADLEAMRATYAAYGRLVGLDVEASRPIDRVSDLIETLEAPDDRPLRLVPSGRGSLARRAPDYASIDWETIEGGESVYWERVLEGEARQPAMTPAEIDAAIERAEETAPPPAVGQAFDLAFENARLALLRYRLLQRELRRREGNADLADWYLAEGPETFGSLREEARTNGEGDERLELKQEKIRAALLEGVRTERGAGRTDREGDALDALSRRLPKRTDPLSSDDNALMRRVGRTIDALSDLEQRLRDSDLIEAVETQILRLTAAAEARFVPGGGEARAGLGTDGGRQAGSRKDGGRDADARNGEGARDEGTRRPPPGRDGVER
ncbi:MAG: hypothetical protein RLW87_20875 [Alphaproteobacteria bacterium]